jgi:hypothetical protein
MAQRTSDLSAKIRLNCLEEQQSLDHHSDTFAADSAELHKRINTSAFVGMSSAFALRTFE